MLMTASNCYNAYIPAITGAGAGSCQRTIAAEELSAVTVGAERGAFGTDDSCSL
jgi:hypothetical protein